MSSRGFTLVELLIAMVVMAILGVALTRMLISDSRFVSRQDAMISARQGARAAMNTMAVELRMVGDGGLLAASPDSITARIPYAFGMSCESVTGILIVSLVPTDSLMYASAVHDGFAWRDDAGTYSYWDKSSVASSSETAACEADSIRVLPGGMLVGISNGPVVPVPPGKILYLHQVVTYRFGASSELPGRVGLWRKVGAAPYEEIIVPFDTAAGFACLVGANLQVETCPPTGGLTAVRGLELRLISASERTPQGSGVPETFSLITKVLFLNKLN